MKLDLVVGDGHHVFESPTLVVIGRSPKADLVISDRRISRRHCQVEILSDRCTIFDLGSGNGTLLNGRRVQESPLFDSDELLIGDTRLLVVCDLKRPTSSSHLSAVSQPLPIANDSGDDMARFRSTDIIKIQKPGMGPPIFKIGLERDGESRGSSQGFETMSFPEGHADLLRERLYLLEVGRAVSSILEIDPLLERIMDVIIELLQAERGFLVLLDPPRATDDTNEVKNYDIRVARNFDHEDIAVPEDEVSRSVVRQVARTGEPLLVSDALRDDRFAEEMSVVELELRSLLCVPLKTSRTLFGVIYLENRTISALFGPRHLDVMQTFAAQAAQAIENAFAFRRIKELYDETLSLARAREKILNHISHELRTPIAVLRGVLRTLARKAAEPEAVQPAFERGERNLQRLVEIQTVMSDIYQAKEAALPAAEPGGPMELLPMVRRLVTEATNTAQGREVEIKISIAEGMWVESPRLPLETGLRGLLRNAIENTPDEGLVEISARAVDEAFVEIAVRDFGVGITSTNRKHIFEGFYHTQETARYSSKRPYQFDAGGKGLDLLRLKTFSERFGWELAFETERCRYIPSDGDACPGRISACQHCKIQADCLGSGWTVFSIELPRADFQA